MEKGEGHQAQVFQLQGYPQQPGGPGDPSLVQSSYANLVVEPPKDHIIWSLCCFVYSNPVCLGLAALIFSIKARDRVMVGDLEGARYYGSTARWLNIISTVLVCLFIVLILISVIVTVVTANSAAGRHN